MGTVWFLSDDGLQFDCNGQIAPLETLKLFGLHPLSTYPTRARLDPRGEDSSTIYTRTRVAPERSEPSPARPGFHEGR